MQIAKMILLDSLEIKATLFNISNVKFSKPIYPNNSNSYLCQISYLINEGFLECVIFIKDSSFTYMSMQCKYTLKKYFEKIMTEA
jgi:3-hydroxymyristoyl/3-hydroxydecanoyl-(acyl carrier protein) dehydratase